MITSGSKNCINYIVALPIIYVLTKEGGKYALSRNYLLGRTQTKNSPEQEVSFQSHVMKNPLLPEHHVQYLPESLPVNPLCKDAPICHRQLQDVNTLKSYWWIKHLLSTARLIFSTLRKHCCAKCTAYIFNSSYKCGLLRYGCLNSFPTFFCYE